MGFWRYLSGVFVWCRAGRVAGTGKSWPVLVKIP